MKSKLDIQQLSTKPNEESRYLKQAARLHKLRKIYKTPVKFCGKFRYKEVVALDDLKRILSLCDFFKFCNWIILALVE